MVFKYFAKKNVPLIGTKCSYHLNVFCLCILTSFSLEDSTPQVEPSIPQMVKNLGSGSLVPIILAETLKGLDVHRKEATFFARSPLFL